MTIVLTRMTVFVYFNMHNRHIRNFYSL